MQDGYWMVRTYEAGSVGEKTKFFVPGCRDRRSKQREREAARKALTNEASAVKAAARLLNANFGKGDLFLGLDYSAEGMKRLEARAARLDPEFAHRSEEERRELLYEAAETELVNVLRRVAREMEKDGGELKYWGITADIDGDTGEPVRVHHHVVVPKESRTAFLQKWEKSGWGGVSWTALHLRFGAEDFTAVAEYCLKQVRRVKHRNRFTSSRNLIRPQPKDRVAYGDTPLRAPKGARILFAREYVPMAPQYIRYVLPEGKRRGPDGKLLRDAEAGSSQITRVRIAAGGNAQSV